MSAAMVAALGAAGLALAAPVARAGEAPGPAPAFASVFGDGMVLQRGQPVRVWGHAAAGQSLTVTLAGAARPATADAAGAWQAEFAPLEAGGPYTMELDRPGGSVQTLQDILVGDVWLCSGQSNMEFPVSRANWNDPGGPASPSRIRLLSIEHLSDVHVQSDYPAAPRWQVADHDSVQDFSAVCYYFARSLQTKQDVPLGLIDASWGGSRIEPWISVPGLEKAGGLDDQIALLQAYADDPVAGSGEFARQWEAWWAKAAADTAPWQEQPGTAGGWKSTPVMADWKSFGDPELEDYNGMVWYGRSFRLSPGQAAGQAELSLGGLDEVDVTWVNGAVVGNQFGWGTERDYTIPAGVLKAGDNTVVVNILSTWGMGGMLGPAERVRLQLADGSSVPLGDGWWYRKVPPAVGFPPRAPWESIGGLSGLYNAMIAPLGGLRLAGAIWYQGESNAGEGRRYETLLNALITDWRKQFGAQLPFLVVQLPDFGPLPTAPAESGWAGLRDAQRRVAAGDPLTGLVVTVDAGDPFDLHPTDKTRVAIRAADVARALVYGAEGLVDGLSPLRASRSGEEVTVEFDPAAGLQVIGDATPVAFELCGDATGSCAYATARLDGHRVILTGPDAATATRVRHCWADAPICNLYAATEPPLPVSSFELEIGNGAEK